MAAWLDVGEAGCVGSGEAWAFISRASVRATRRSGCDMRLPGAVRPNSVWSYDFVHDQFVDGRVLKMLCVLDEHTGECLAICAGQWLRCWDVILTLSRLMRIYGKPQHPAATTARNSRRAQ